MGTYTDLLKLKRPKKPDALQEDKPREVNTTTPERPNVRTENRTDFRTENRSDIKPVLSTPKRRTTRYSFEFFDDQITRLKELKYRAEMNGEKVTLSDFVREAMDKYLSRKKP